MDMSTENTNTPTVANQVDAVASLVEGINIDTENVTPFVFTGANTLIQQVSRAREFVAESEFTTDADRKSLNKVKAITNKIIAAYKAEVKRAKAEVFAEAEAQQAAVEAELRALGAEIKERVDHFEKVYRDEKRTALIEQATDRMDADPDFIAFIRPEMLIDERWLNRSVSIQKAVKELDQRFSAIEAVTAVTEDQDRAVEELIEADFDTAAAISAVMAEQKRLAEQKLAAEEAKRAAEAERQRIIAEYEAAKNQSQQEAPDEPEQEDATEDEPAEVEYVTLTVTVPAENEVDLLRLVRRVGGKVED